MLVIRHAQMEAVRATAARAFEAEMLAHLAQFSPPLFKTIGEAQLRVAIQLGVRGAGEHGFTTRGPVRLYLELMLLLGSRFDTDPQYPWAGEILNDGDSDTQRERAGLLHQRTLDYLENVSGPNDAYALAALRKIPAIVQASQLSPATFAADVFDEISGVYPQKAAYVGTQGLQAIIREGGWCARSYHFSSPRAYALIILLMLAFGHGCTDDPLYPWISRTLRDPAVTDPAARAERLERRALTWLAHVLAYFDGAPQS